MNCMGFVGPLLFLSQAVARALAKALRNQSEHRYVTSKNRCFQCPPKDCNNVEPLQERRDFSLARLQNALHFLTISRRSPLKPRPAKRCEQVQSTFGSPSVQSCSLRP
jgi:hypothetical protein